MAVGNLGAEPCVYISNSLAVVSHRCILCWLGQTATVNFWARYELL